MLVDTDGDPLEDQQTVYSDELATPYGLFASDRFVDVITKTALLRLTDHDNDGRADKADTLASGWGHTDDYHDWAVGLPTTMPVFGLPCQQDDRSTAAAPLRQSSRQAGSRDPTAEIRNDIRLLTSLQGQRFPMGLALSRSGHLFATDNQGNYNPFNELNHIVEGRHYGFVNQADRGSGEMVAHATQPAIAIPHRWTQKCKWYLLSGIARQRINRSSRAIRPVHRTSRRLRIRYASPGQNDGRAGELRDAGHVYPLSRSTEQQPSPAATVTKGDERSQRSTSLLDPFVALSGPMEHCMWADFAIVDGEVQIMSARLYG